MELFVPTCSWMLSSATPWPLFAYFMLFSSGECVVAAIFLRNGDRHLDGVAILVLLVRCIGTQWFAVVSVFLEYTDIDALK